MSGSLIHEVASSSAPLHRLNAVKEFLQGIILAGLERDGLLANIGFQGGTALRLIHGLRRYSEDLDFARLEGSFDPDIYERSIVTSCGKQLLFPRIGSEKTVAANTTDKELLRINLAIGADNNLKKLISAHQVQITLEIDLKPPAHIETEQKNTKSGVPVRVFTLQSLMSGKLHILLTRKDREKGRDWYDYIWYRKLGILPNLPQLQSAIDQTGPPMDASTWAAALDDIILAKNWTNLRNDVKPFLERLTDLDDLTADKMLVLNKIGRTE